MQLAIVILLFVVGIIIIIFSSNIAVKHSSLFATALGISPLLIGATLVSIGTDIPEIFNSIISCALGHGDIDVGDSVGSDLTQLTLVFGLLPIITGSFKIERKEIILLGACELLSLLVIYTVVEKGYFTRLNAILMIASLIVYFVIISYTISKKDIVELTHNVDIIEAKKNRFIHLTIAIFGFIGVAVGAYMIVDSVIIISEMLHIHEYIISFFIASLGTSLPELVVDVKAIKDKQYKMAVGDIVGSCIVDSTLSIGIGQALFPQAVTASLAIPTILYTLVASFIVFLVIGINGKINKKIGMFFIFLYLFSYIFFFSAMGL